MRDEFCQSEWFRFVCVCDWAVHVHTYLPLDLKALAQGGTSTFIRRIDSKTRDLLSSSLVASATSESKADEANGQG